MTGCGVGPFERRGPREEVGHRATKCRFGLPRPCGRCRLRLRTRFEGRVEEALGALLAEYIREASSHEQRWDREITCARFNRSSRLQIRAARPRGRIPVPVITPVRAEANVLRQAIEILGRSR